MNETRQNFFDAAAAWLCDGYSASIRYVGGVQDGNVLLWGASIWLGPLKIDQDLSFSIQTADVVAGQVQSFPLSKVDALAIVEQAAVGTVQLPKVRLALPQSPNYDYYSEMGRGDRWFSDLHLQVSAARMSPPTAERLLKIDNELRASQPPFDGLADVSAWLGVGIPALTGTSPMLAARVLPPVDLILDQCGLREDEIRLVLHAHPGFDVGQVRIAVRGVPGVGLRARQQVTTGIEWSEVRDGRREGVARIAIASVDQMLVMLMIGMSIVRRHWFLDPAKARNNRLLAFQHFDVDLRMIRNAVFESQDSMKFEQGIAALLYLHGFSPAIQIETNAPDLIVSTPGGRMAVVECTTRVADISTKLGKLVDRRGALAKAIGAAGHSAQILAVLVCRLPRDQIAAHEANLRTHKVLLIAGENLQQVLDSVRHPGDPDQVFDQSQLRLGTVEVASQ